jgi:hypothetical protein
MPYALQNFVEGGRGGKVSTLYNTMPYFPPSVRLVRQIEKSSTEGGKLISKTLPP